MSSLMWGGHGRCCPSSRPFKEACPPGLLFLWLPECSGWFCSSEECKHFWKDPGAQGFVSLPLGDVRGPFLTVIPPLTRYICLFYPLLSIYLFMCQLPLVVLLESVVLIYGFLSSLVLVYTYIMGCSADWKSGCFLVASPKHFPRTIPFLCSPSTSFSALCQGLGPQFVALKNHSLLKSKWWRLR